MTCVHRDDYDCIMGVLILRGPYLMHGLHGGSWGFSEYVSVDYGGASGSSQ